MDSPDSPERSVQERHSPKSICFGCGPLNAHGLHIRSFERPATATDGSATIELVATWRAAPHHQAFPGMLNGGITGALLDCHSNWMAAMHLMRKSGDTAPPCTVTADFAVKLKRPTPVDGPLELRAWVVESTADRAIVDATLTAAGKITATCHGTFVAVKPGHPAYHRW
ncbi:MAG: PaaI family thioesterase [Planctomycetes bacterium]|nr:PaaI family thioesterase [Planctomycetota bacterium]